jgi:hypothetical protein
VPVEHQVLVEHRLMKSCSDCLLLLVIVVVMRLSLVVNRILLYGGFHFKGGLLYLDCVIKSEIQETLSGSISYGSIAIG